MIGSVKLSSLLFVLLLTARLQIDFFDQALIEQDSQN